MPINICQTLSKIRLFGSLKHIKGCMYLASGLRPDSLE